MSAIFLGCQNNTQKNPGFCDEEKAESFISVTLNEIGNEKIATSQQVEVEGFFHYYFEDVALYLATNKDISKALWLNFNDLDSNKNNILEDLAGKKVKVIGVIDLTSKGHLGNYIGTLNNVICITPKE